MQSKPGSQWAAKNCLSIPQPRYRALPALSQHGDRADAPPNRRGGGSNPLKLLDEIVQFRPCPEITATPEIERRILVAARSRERPSAI
jgi:hypothetical protein